MAYAVLAFSMSLVSLAVATRRYQVLMDSPWPTQCEVNLKRPQTGLPDWSEFSMQANPNNSFLGPIVSTIYKAGKYPIFSGMGPGNWNATNATSKNGGLPQLVNLSAHLTQLRLDIETILPDPNSSGVANIDWEAWKPDFYGNAYNEYWIYINRSIMLVQQEHPDWDSARQILQAEQDFNAAARRFFNASIQLCRQLRPRTRWGW